MKKRIFAVISKLAFGIYGRVAIFGTLRAAVGVVNQGERFLVIDRSDGRGYSFPGGLALPWENNEQALIREVHEETALHVSRSRFMAAYFSQAPIPCNIHVFRVEVSGRLGDSWEGTPVWVELKELKNGVASSQRYIVENLLPLLGPETSRQQIQSPDCA
jgi:8-oxo-dGTP diphosphatase